MTDVLKDFLFIDQLKIMGYGESDTSGCWIKFQLTPELLEVVRGRKGEMVEVAARLIDNSGEYIPISAPEENINTAGPEPDKVEQESFGRFWQRLIAHGTFNAPPVLEAIGTDDEFQDWIRLQPSCLSGGSDWLEDLGEGRCECAHVRRIVEGAGVSRKPPYYAVPLTHAEHVNQHEFGETAVLKHAKPKKGPDPGVWTEAQAKTWFEKKAQHYRLEWASTRLVKTLGHERRRDCPREDVQKWVEAMDLTQYFPRDKG